MKKLAPFFMLLLSAFSPNSFAQITIYVPADYATIQAAVNAATHPLDVIEVSAGSYGSAVSISKSITIKGPNAGSSGYGSRAAEAILSDAKLTISGAHTVTIDGLKIYQTNNTADAVLLGGATTVNFKNCIVERFGISTGTIARGLTTSSGSGVKTISHCLFTGDNSGGLFSGHKTWNSGVYLNAASSTIFITDNKFENCRTAINADDFNAGVTITGNEFADNGTHMSFGGVSATGGSYALSGNEFKQALSALINLSNVQVSFRLDITMNTLNGAQFSTYPLATLFQVEQLMFHRGRSSRNGLVTYVAGKQYVIPINPSIQAAVDYGLDGQDIHIAPGTFSVNVNLNKRISLLGSGSGSDPNSATIISQSASGAGDASIGILQLNASGLNGNRLKIKDMRLLPSGMAGISVGKFLQGNVVQISHVDMENVVVKGTDRPNPCSERERGFYVDRTSTFSNGSFINCSFNDLEYGWYLHKDLSADASNVSQIEVKQCTFQNNVSKGLYAEKLSDALFENCSIVNNGDQTWTGTGCDQFRPFLAGIDINLKAGSYSNITIRSSEFTGNGIGQAREGAALVIKARSDAPSYTSFPASLNNVLVENCIITGNERGIRLGEPGKSNPGPTAVVIKNNALFGNNKTYSGNDGTAYGDLVNLSLAQAEATCNWFGSSELPTIQLSTFGPLTLVPFLQNGTDASLDMGFQPGGPCISPVTCSFSVVCFQQGALFNGGTVPAARSNPGKALVAENSDVTGTINFFSLGFGGYIILKSSCPIKDGPGNDVQIWETTFGTPPGGLLAEKAKVYASQDGINFLLLGTATYDGAFDLQSVGLNWATHFRIEDVTSLAGAHPGNADGYDLDGLEVLNGYATGINLDPIVLGGPSTVCGFTQGKMKNFSNVPPFRSIPAKATGVPENDNSLNFVSLGFGGEICLKFDFAILDGPGPELQVVETTFGNLTCSAYPEKAEVAVSFNGTDWNVLGVICQDDPGLIDITAPNSGIQYVRIKDVSQRSDFASATADGYDLDGILAISSFSGNPPCQTTSNRPMILEEPIATEGQQIPEELSGLVTISNPVKDVATLEFGLRAEKATLSFRNSMGKLISEQMLDGSQWEIRKMEIPMSDLKTGIYFVTLTQNGESETIRIIKE